MRAGPYFLLSSDSPPPPTRHLLIKRKDLPLPFLSFFSLCTVAICIFCVVWGGGGRGQTVRDKGFLFQGAHV
jgi:hypothetical protein